MALVVFQDRLNRRVAVARWGWEHAGRLVAHGPREALSQRPLSVAWPRHRCAVMVTAWMHANGSGLLPTIVQPFYGRGSTATLAALWMTTTGEDGKPLAAVVVLTVPACKELIEVNARQPAILPREHIDRWLDEATPLHALKRLLVSHMLYEAKHYQPEVKEWERLSRPEDVGPFATFGVDP